MTSGVITGSTACRPRREERISRRCGAIRVDATNDAVLRDAEGLYDIHFRRHALADQLGGKHPKGAVVVLGVLKHRLNTAEICPLTSFADDASITSLMRVAPSAMSGNNAWGMVPSSWCVPGDLDNHGRYHFYFPPRLLIPSDKNLPNRTLCLRISLTPCNLINGQIRRSEASLGVAINTNATAGIHRIARPPVCRRELGSQKLAASLMERLVRQACHDMRFIAAGFICGSPGRINARRTLLAQPHLEW